MTRSSDTCQIANSPPRANADTPAWNAELGDLLTAAGVTSGIAGSLGLGLLNWSLGPAPLFVASVVAICVGGWLVHRTAGKTSPTPRSLRTVTQGALALGVLSAVWGLATGWGHLVTAMAAGGAITATMAGMAATVPGSWWRMRGPFGRVHRWTRGELLAFGGLALVLLAAASWIIAAPAPLGHDESVYAVQARSWLTGEETNSVSAHRAPLLSVALLPIVAFTTAEPILRLIGVASGLIGIAAVWTLGRIIFGPFAAWVATATFSLAPSVLNATGYALTDLPAAGLLILALAVCWWQFEQRPVPGRGLLLLAPLVAAALMLRYGSALPVALITCTVAGLWPRQLWRGRVQVVLTGGLFLLLWMPEGIRATAEFGAPWGRIMHTSQAARSDDVGSGLAGYAAMFPHDLAGPIVAVMLTIAVFGAIVALGRSIVRRDASLARPWLLLLLPATAHLVFMGINSPAEPRFVFLSLAYGCVAGAGTLAGVLRVAQSGLGEGTATAMAAVIGAAVLCAGASTAAHLADQRRDAGVESPVREGSKIVAAASAGSGGDCAVLTGFVPQIEWYSGCAAFRITGRPAEEQLAELPGRHRFLFFYREGKGQPPRDERSPFTRAPGMELVTDWEGRYGDAELYRLPESPVNDRS